LAQYLFPRLFPTRAITFSTTWYKMWD
jgi:hypothetical protein